MNPARVAECGITNWEGSPTSASNRARRQHYISTFSSCDAARPPDRWRTDSKARRLDAPVPASFFRCLREQIPEPSSCIFRREGALRCARELRNLFWLLSAAVAVSSGPIMSLMRLLMTALSKPQSLFISAKRASHILVTAGRSSLNCLQTSARSSVIEFGRGMRTSSPSSTWKRMSWRSSGGSLRKGGGYIVLPLIHSSGFSSKRSRCRASL